ncbi:hypothetical protein NEFER01_2196 [Nematocida sp. LUAm1]|nr:hypothetical protein NEFER01_2196 [Nematocida sp. LUAm1]
MKIALRRTRESTYTVAYAWKMLAVFILLLSIVCSMDAFLGNPADVERRKKEMAEVLLNNFEMFTRCSNNNVKDILDGDHLFSQIEYVKLDKQSTGWYCIDVKDYEIEIDGLQVVYRGDIHTIMEDIGVIRCKRLYTDPDVPFELVKMLFERIVVEKSIEIYGLCWENTDFVTSLLNDNTCSLREEIVLSLKWAAITPLKIYIAQYSWNFTENILNKWVGTREIKEIYLYYSNVEAINLQGLKMAEECSIAIENFLNMKSILLPKAVASEYMCIQLLNLPNLKKIWNIRNIYSSKTIDNLILDRYSFKVLMDAYRENEHLQTVLRVWNLHLLGMPRTFQEVAKISYFWLLAEDIIFYIDHCKSCCISEEEDMVYYSSDVIKSMGIDCLKAPSYENLSVNLSKYMDKCIFSSMFLKRIGVFTNKMSPRFFECPYDMYNVDTSKRLPRLKIHLKNSKEIQEAIEEFQKSYNTLCVHAHYSMLDINGLYALEEDTKVLEEMFACMGVRIRVDVLRFYNVKGSIDDETEENHLVPVQASKNKFDLQTVEFYNSEISFIRSMLTKYSYFPNAMIIIDCKGIKKEEDLWGLFPRLMKSELFEVKLMNTEKIMEDLHKNGCSIDKKLLDSKNNPVLPIGNFKWAKKFPYIINYMFSKKNTISSAHLSKLARESLKVKESKKTKNRKELSHFLVSNSAKEAYEELKKCMKTVCHVVWVDVYIYNIKVINNSIVIDLLEWIGMFKKVFMDLEVLCILNLMIQEHETKCWNISHVVDPLKNTWKLQDVVLKHYTLIDEQGKDITTQLDYKERIVKCYSGEEILDKLANTNIAINLRVLWYMLQSIVTEDEEFLQWVDNILDDDECIICGENISKIAEAYIMWHCGHWRCMKCAIKCAKEYVQANSDKDRNTCHICRAPAEFDKEFYLLNLKDPEREEQIKAEVERKREERKAASNPPSLEQSNEKPKEVAETNQVPSEDPNPIIIEEFEEFKACSLAPPNPNSLVFL